MNSQPAKASPDLHVNEWPDQVLTEGTTVQGVLTCNTPLFFDGMLKGTLVHGLESSSPDTLLVIGPKSRIEGVILAKTVIIHGYVEGDVLATHTVHVSNLGYVSGTVKTTRLRVDYGGVIQGLSQTKVPNIAALIHQLQSG